MLAGGDLLAVPGAVGSCEHSARRTGVTGAGLGRSAPSSGFEAVEAAGRDVRGALDELLTRWREHLAAVPGADADDTAAVVTWPSRDIEGPGSCCGTG